MDIHASAPISILDIGGWTDTPFAEHGAVLNLAVDYPTRVMIRPRKRSGVMIRTRVIRQILHLGGCERPCPLEYDLLRAIARYFNLDGLEAELTYAFPPECGFHAVASAAVAMTGALAAYAGKNFTSLQLAGIAHALHSEVVGQPVGLGGHVAAAVGGIALYRTTPHPRIFASSLNISPELAEELTGRLLLVLTGRTEREEIHQRLAGYCEDTHSPIRNMFWRLRALPAQALEALQRWDFTSLGKIITENAAIQYRLCHSLRTPEVHHLELLARQHPSTTMKVNGEGGSVTLFAGPKTITTLRAHLHQAEYTVLPVPLDTAGLRLWNAYLPITPAYAYQDEVA